MTTFYAQYPVNGVPVYPTLSAFPNGGGAGQLAVAADTGTLYEWNGSAWVAIAAPGDALSIGPIDSTAASANGVSIVADALIMQSASVTAPGLVNLTTQSFAGNKTFTGSISASNLSGTNTGDVTLGTASGLSLAGQVLSLGVASAGVTGALTGADWTTFNNKQNALTTGNLTDVGTDGIVITGGTGAVIGAGTSLAQHVADTTHNGYLSSTDWNTFNGKQAAGSYITALTGDVTASGPGSAAATLATVNGNVGSFTNANITVNAKGLITAAANGAASGGTVTSVSVVSANGLAGTVATATTTPAITLSTSITGILQGNGTAISAATTGNLTDAGTDGITVTGGTGAVLGSGTSLAQQKADATHNGYLASIDWNTFNGKQSTLTFADSLVNSLGTVTLVGDSASPGNTMYYGTNGAGTLGYYSLSVSGANAALSNLASVAINTSLVFAVSPGNILGQNGGAGVAGGNMSLEAGAGNGGTQGVATSSPNAWLTLTGSSAAGAPGALTGSAGNGGAGVAGAAGKLQGGTGNAATSITPANVTVGGMTAAGAGGNSSLRGSDGASGQDAGFGRMLGGSANGGAAAGGATIVANGGLNAGTGGAATITGGTANGSNQAAGGVTISTGNSTGNSSTAAILLKTAPVGGSGSGANAAITAVTIGSDQSSTFAGTVKTGFGMADSGYDYVTGAGNFVIPAGASHVIVNAGAQVTLTVTMPAAPNDGQLITISFPGAVTTLTVAANAGQTLDGTLTTAAANAFASWIYVLSATTWFRCG